VKINEEIKKKAEEKDRKQKEAEEYIYICTSCGFSLEDYRCGFGI